MKFTILSVSFPFAPVRPDTPGGAEQVLGTLDSALTHRGHLSIVIACEGSHPAGILIATPHVEGFIDDRARIRAQEAHRQAIGSAMNRFRVDLVHMHGLDFDRYLPEAGVPVLVTLHLPCAWYAPGVFHPDRPETCFNCVSRAQQTTFPKSRSLLVENGVPIGALAFRVRKRSFALAVGRICPEKGFHLALEAAAERGVPLFIAGSVFPYEEHERYFREMIFPRLGPRAKFIGPIGPERKRRLLSAARCLLVPSLAPETSSLVAMEALACGTPVVAFPAGALAEIVEDGKTGFLVGSSSEMAEAIDRCDRLDPENCRKAARERFSSERMVDSYLDLYQSIIRQHDAKGSFTIGPLPRE